MTGTAPGPFRPEALRDCAVMVEVAGGFAGCGFLVAPGLVAGAAHVLVEARREAAPVAVRHASGVHPVATGAVRLFPDTGDGGRFHPFPDLALLSVPGLTGHPVAPLASGPPEPGARLTALGFSTYTPDLGTARPDTLALRVVGRAGDYVRVSGDGVRDGHSGSMLVGADGAVHGVLKASRSYELDQGGWFTPVGALRALLVEAGIDVPGPIPVPPPPGDGELVAALMPIPLLQRLDGRFLLLDAMSRALGVPYAFEVAEHPTQRLHLHGIVRGCRSFRDGRVALRALVTAVEELAPDDGALDELRRLVGRATGGREGA
ncbi:trypsin-like peptidase domain-containing protein [Kitasatospora sp. NPDC057500]|uniref:effector-associated domain 2-containing protein n=1 Tax=Kitasatospora sp. NPDC057500 TaxID=3346151 RepID=UPI00369BF634